jgi:L-ascorbate metabolism protein UlaG (beta-lactamase superfamily)
MKIKWYGHASFLLTSKDGVKVITDPYESGAFGGALSYGKIPDEADVVTVSHDHADHYTSPLKGKPHIINKEGKFTIKGIEFIGIPTFHDTSEGKERGKNLLFCFTIDGIKVCHCGDLGHRLSKEEVGKVGKVDLLLIPVGGFYTLEPPDAVKVCQDINPKMIIPMHYKTEKCNFPIVDAEEFLKGWKEIKRMTSSEMELEASKLPPRTEVITLEYAL